MTNKDKYLREGVSVEEYCKGFYQYLASKDKISFGYDKSNVGAYLQDFLNEQTKPTLTEDERIKEMVYTKERKREVLATGYYFGLLYYVLSLGTHPTAYVKIPETHWLYNIDNYDDMPIDCHGGLTYCEDFLLVGGNQEVTGKFIGWDYTHCGDYAPYYDDLPKISLAEKSKKWTTQEILEEVRDVCSQIIELEKKPQPSEDEKAILRNIDTYYEKIGRSKKDIEGNTDVYIKGKNSCEVLLGFNENLFQFIKERRRIRNKGVIK